MEFVIVTADSKAKFERQVNDHLAKGFVFAGNIVFSAPDTWYMPMIEFSERTDADGKNMENRLAKQLWGMFIARLF
jgi:hypothetical protein